MKKIFENSIIFFFVLKKFDKKKSTSEQLLAVPFIHFSLYPAYNSLCKLMRNFSKKKI